MSGEEWSELEEYDFNVAEIELWRDTEDTLCEEATALSWPEYDYSVTRRGMNPAWVVGGVAEDNAQLKCPLIRGHDGSHLALVGYAYLQLGPDDEFYNAGHWYIAWGPGKDGPRTVRPRARCENDLTVTDLTVTEGRQLWSLMNTHPRCLPLQHRR